MTDQLPEPFVYQDWGANKLVRLKKSAVIGKPGCGKTRTLLMAAERAGLIVVDEEGDAYYPEGPVLVTCSGPAILTWLKQTPLWLDVPWTDMFEVSGKKQKSAAARRAMWEQARKTKDGIYVTNFSVFLLDKEYIEAVKWGLVISDEYHKAMRRHKGQKGKDNQTYKFFYDLTKRIEYVFMGSGSMVRKNPSSMWTLFRILQPFSKVFRSYWRYVDNWCHVNDGMFGKEILGPKNVHEFNALVDRHIAYIPEELVAEHQPDGKRNIIPIKMTPPQKRIYDQLAEELWATYEEQLTVVANPLALTLKLRQLLCFPEMVFKGAGIGGGMEWILDQMSDDPHVVIFVPFRPACELVVETLRAKKFPCAGILRGGITTREQDNIIEQFRTQMTAVVCTIAYGESFDLETCKTSHFLGYDYSLDVLEQCEGRTQRASSEHDFISWNYTRYEHTIDEHFLGELDIDARNVRRILRRPEEYIRRLRGDTNG